MKTISVGVIDDHPLFREGVIHSLREAGYFEIVGQGGTAAAALSVATRKPDVLLIDLSMPGGGLSVISPILDQNPDQRIVVLTVSERGEDMAEAIRFGARGYVVKGVGSRALVEILRLVVSGERYISPTLAANLVISAQRTKPEKMSRLNARENEILALVTSGMSNKRIAIHLGLQEKTVKYYMTRIMTKLEVVNRTEAAMAFRDATTAPTR